MIGSNAFSMVTLIVSNLTLFDKLEQWTKHWQDIKTYPLNHRDVPGSLHFLKKLRTEVLTRDCSSSWDYAWKTLVDIVS